jgi:hypothetical protein
MDYPLPLFFTINVIKFIKERKFMRIELLDIEKLISLNKLKEVTSPWLFLYKNMYDPKGLVSYDIFGVSKGDRRGTFGYIDLKRPFLHPHIYANVLKRMHSKIITGIISGQERYSIQDGFLKEDPEGWTGVQKLYDNWENINWKKSPSVSEHSKSLLSKLDKNSAFITKLIVCPPAYRDISNAGTIDNSDHVDKVNELYQKVIRAISFLEEGSLFSETQYATQMKIQETLVEISNYFKIKISKKSGLIRQYLIGKNISFGTRSVISAFSYNNETIQENMVDLEHTALPISQCCSTFYPFIEAWLKNFFTREIINDPNVISFYNMETKKEIIAKLKEPEINFSEKNIRKMINDYIFNPDNRFKIIQVEATIPGGKKDHTIKAQLFLKGKAFLENNIQKELNRPMTITDILYLACVDICEKRHVMITRYPVGTDKGLFFNKVQVQSTRDHQKVIFNGKEYPYFPKIDFKIPTERIGIQFIDTCVYSNSLLEGMGKPPDQCPCKTLLIAENLTCLNILNYDSDIMVA